MFLKAMLTTHGAHDHSKVLSDSHGAEEAEHDMNLWKGFVAALAVVFFYFTEKCLSLLTEWRKRRQRNSNVCYQIITLIIMY